MSDPSVEDYINFAASYILENGYVSKSKVIREGSTEIPTTDLVDNIYLKTPVSELNLSEEAKDLVQYVYTTYWKTLEEKKNIQGLNNFEETVYSLIKSDKFVEHQSGFITAAVNTALSQKKTQDIASKSRHAGKIGKRFGGVATVTGVYSYDSQYGAGTRIHLISESGNEYVWFASGSKSYTVGKKYNVVGTVKAHNVFKGVKQTIINRCRIDEIEELEEME